MEFIISPKKIPCNRINRTRKSKTPFKLGNCIDKLTNSSHSVANSFCERFVKERNMVMVNTMAQLFGKLGLMLIYTELGIHCLCDSKECVFSRRELLCSTCIPDVVPDGVVKVIVTNNTIPMTNETFSHISWQRPAYLDITETEQITTTLV